VAGSQTGCTTTAACTASNGGRPSVCRTPGSPCIDIATDVCPVVSEGWDSPDAIFIGSLSQSNTQNVDDRFWGDAHEAGYKLALAEVMANNGGLGGGVNGAKRPVVGVYCNLEAMKSSAERAAEATSVVQHLTRDVKVTAIATQDEHNTVPALTVIAAEKVFTMCSYCASTPVATTPMDGLLWRAVSPFTDTVEVWNNLVQNFEARVRKDASYGIGATAPIRIALAAAPSDEYVAGLAEAVSNGIKWNGAAFSGQAKGLSDNLPNFLRTTNDSWEASSASASVYSAVQQIVSFQPQIVLLTNDTEAIRLMIPLIEGLWPAGKARPYYVLNASDFHQQLPVLVGSDDSLRKRIAGVVASADAEVTANIAGLATRLGSVLPAGRSLDAGFIGSAAGPYDAAYSLVYAIAASGVANPTGADLRTGMSRLTSGPTINLNSSDFNSGLAVLAAGQSINLTGTLTTLDWDQANHVIHQPTAAFCVDRDSNTGNPYISGSLSPFQRRPGDPIVGDVSCF